MKTIKRFVVRQFYRYLRIFEELDQPSRALVKETRSRRQFLVGRQAGLTRPAGTENQNQAVMPRRISG
jgi:hypothetical protein